MLLECELPCPLGMKIVEALRIKDLILEGLLSGLGSETLIGVTWNLFPVCFLFVLSSDSILRTAFLCDFVGACSKMSKRTSSTFLSCSNCRSADSKMDYMASKTKPTVFFAKSVEKF